MEVLEILPKHMWSLDTGEWSSWPGEVPSSIPVWGVLRASRREYTLCL